MYVNQLKIQIAEIGFADANWSSLTPAVASSHRKRMGILSTQLAKST